MNEYDRQPELVGLMPPLWSRGVANQLARHRGRSDQTGALSQPSAGRSRQPREARQ